MSKLTAVATLNSIFFDILQRVESFLSSNDEQR
jgi:hypothetical protein